MKTIRITLLGRLMVLRALYYYTLLEDCGAVNPISLEPLERCCIPLQLKQAQSATKWSNGALNQIQILQASIKCIGMPDNPPEGKQVVLSKAATLALKADVYIWSGNLLGERICWLYGRYNRPYRKFANFRGRLEEQAFPNLWGWNEITASLYLCMNYKQARGKTLRIAKQAEATEIKPLSIIDIGGNLWSSFCNCRRQ